VDYSEYISIPVSYCRLCKRRNTLLFSGKVLDLSVRYYECTHCGFVQTEEPTWLDKAYSQVINVSDTGLVSRNLHNRNIVLSILLGMGNAKEKVIDYAGGYGLLVRLLRDYGVDAYWMDKFARNLMAPGFEYDEKASGVKIITAFEVFEHLVHPCKEIEQILLIAPNILFSTDLMPKKTPKLDEWSYYGVNHGQHIGFYRYETLQYLADRYGKKLLSDRHSYHMLCEPRTCDVLSVCFKHLVRFSRFAPMISSFILKSKTWSDHLSLRDLE